MKTTPAHPCAPNLSTEWLLTNALGSFAMGTTLGSPTRRYHSLLNAALHPPVQRTATLTQVVESLRLHAPAPAEHWLTPLRFAQGPQPDRPSPLQAVTRDRNTCTWQFSLPCGLTFTKSLALAYSRNLARLTYCLDAGSAAGLLTLHPLVALRDFHDLNHIGPRLEVTREPRALVLAHDAARLRLEHETLVRRDEPVMWRDVFYPREADRGQDCTEDLLIPATYRLEFLPGQRVEASLWIIADDQPPEPIARRTPPGLEIALRNVPESDSTARLALSRLVESADAFIVRRGFGPDAGTTVLAGYPWFADWGRDTMIALPGLLIETGRLDEACAVLDTFARATRRGLVPNRFDDYADSAHYNTVDASLWFIHAVTELLSRTREVPGSLLPACLAIIDAYEQGTDYGIHLAPDGLIAAGSPDTQLTWMDAQRDGVTFTPRFGKPVEINALWHHALLRLAQVSTPPVAHRLHDLANRCRIAFAKFVRPAGGLYDGLESREGIDTPVDCIRPNQIFAASLEHAPLDLEQRQSVVRIVREHLLTPFGLRTLSPTDPAFEPHYRGTLFERDRAYHNGTAWPWLLGHYAEAVMRTSTDLHAAREHLRTVLTPLVDRMDHVCIGHVSEVAEATDPFAPEGCPAQAWSTAELLRAWRLIAAS
jgi:predicted glycogen debranching enzyme